MFKYLLLAFIVVPFLELYLLLAIGREVGFWPTVAGVLFTSVVGAWLARKEGLRVLRRWQESLAQGRTPDEGLVSGVLVLVGGVLLVFPGVLTDVIGLFLLLPPTRRLVAALVRRRLERRMAEGTLRVTTFQSGAFSGENPFEPRASRPRIHQGPGNETDAEFTEE